jgi:hypothetical protein
MNSFDWLIIYLTCGAPLGVFYFLQNRKSQIGLRLWLKTFFTFIFWLPFGFRLLENRVRKNFTAGKKVFSGTAKTDAEFFLIKKQFEEALQKSNLQISIFEFREVFERYVGLTIAKDCADGKITQTQKEFFLIGNTGAVEIGAICLNRRNLKRLTFHQTQARQDFFQIINQLAAHATDKITFVKFAADFFRLLNDTEAQFVLNKSLSGDLHNKKGFAINRSESYLWNTEIRKPLTANTTTLQLQTLTPPANSSIKD